MRALLLAFCFAAAISAAAPGSYSGAVDVDGAGGSSPWYLYAIAIPLFVLTFGIACYVVDRWPGTLLLFPLGVIAWALFNWLA